MASSPHSLHLRASLILLGLIAVVGVSASPRAVAGPVTNGPGVAPFTKLGVYQGVIAVAPVRSCVGGANPGASCPVGNECTGGGVCTAASVLEIGNAGRDIAGTGELYLRPGGLDRSAGLRLYRAGNNRAELLFSGGSLCLGTVSPSTCRSSWPSSGGSGDTYWAEYASSPKICVGGRYAGIGCLDSSECVGGGVCTAQSPQTVLQPSAAATPASIRIGRSNAPIPSTSGRAVEVYGNGSPVVKISGGLTTGLDIYDSGTGLTSFLGGNLSIAGNLFVRNIAFERGAWENGDFPINPYNSIDQYSSYNPTYRQYGTEGSINADTFDSDTVLPFASYYCRQGSNPGASCVNGTGNGPNAAACLGGGVCQKNDLQVVTVDIPNTTAVLGHMCLKTNNAKLCAGGTAASNAGTPCTDNSQCTNGAICTSMCQSTLQTCPLDPRPTANDPIGGFRCYGGLNDSQSCTVEGFSTAECPDCSGPGCPASAKRCSNGGAVCTTNAECGGSGVCVLHSVGQCTPYRCENTNKSCTTASDCGTGVACLRGTMVSSTVPINSCASLNCQNYCQTFQVACNGTTADPVCGAYGTSARYTNGEPARFDYWLGSSCGPDCSAGCPPGPLVYRQFCDCYVDTSTEYYQAQPPGPDGLLCTGNFN